MAPRKGSKPIPDYLFDQVHPTLNKNKKLSDYSGGSNEKFWWLCKNSKCGCEHAWEAAIKDIAANKSHCPYCSSNKIKFCIHQSFLYTHPQLAAQWNKSENGDKKPDQYSDKNSTEKFWFTCGKTCEYGCEHTWESTISNRVNGSGCPYCRHLKHCIHESILFTHPEIAKQFHPTKNGNKKPEDYTYGSGAKIWWLCPIKFDCGCEHTWEATIGNRIGRNSSCPYCCKIAKKFCIHDSFLYTHPKIAIEWDYEENDKGPEDYSYGSVELISWKCLKSECGCVHKWTATINSRTSNGNNCPYCYGNHKHCYHQSLEYLHPDIAAQWHKTKNENLKPRDVLPCSHKKVWWECYDNKLCDCKHVWCVTIKNRVLAKSKCPYCYGNHSLCIHQSLFHNYPEIMLEWDYSKNKNLDPKNLLPNSHVEVSWICKNPEKICDCIHEWNATIASRVHNGNNCPYCCEFSTRVCYHKSLEYLFPNLIKEWDFAKNKLDPKTIPHGCGKKAFWQCLINKNHKWDAVISNRTKGAGCPYCKNKTEAILYEFLNENYDIVKSAKFNWCKNLKTNQFLPFDFCIENLKLIFELDGGQHFFQVSNWNSPKYNQMRDKYKMDLALKNGYTIIRLLQEDVYKNNYDWKIEIIKYIKKYKIPQIIYLCQNNEYDEYILKLEKININSVNLDDEDKDENEDDDENENEEKPKKKLILKKMKPKNEDEDEEKRKGENRDNETPKKKISLKIVIPEEEKPKKKLTLKIIKPSKKSN